MRRSKPLFMQKIKAYIFLLCLSLCNLSMADEGMWLPTAIPDTLFDWIDEAGGDLTADDIYHTQETSLKDQVVYLSNGHSGVIVSKEGLLLTNYAPFTAFIEQSDSLMNGFLASDNSQEIPISNLYALQLKRSENITERIQKATDATLNEQEYKKQIDSICQQIYLEQVKTPGHMVQIEQNSNHEFYLYEYTQYNDIRLVYVPAKDIATYSLQKGYTPQRHVADFCLLRIYTSRDNMPANYSEFNVPAQDMPHATLSRIKKQVGDPVFYLGYPNQSERNLLSYEWQERMADDSAKIRVWQFLQANYQAQTLAWQDSLKREEQIIKQLGLIERQRSKEWDFTYWAANHSQFETALRYGNLLPFLQNTYKTRCNHLVWYRTSSELLKYVNSVQMGFLLLDMNSQNEASTLAQISHRFSKLNIEQEKKWLCKVLEYYKTVCDTTYMPNFYQLIDKKYKGDTQKYVDYILKKSFLTDEKRFTKYLDNPTEKQRCEDAFLQLCNQLKQVQRLHYLLYIEHDPFVERSKRLYREALYNLKGEQTLPEANYSLRLGYGQIQGYHLGQGICANAMSYLNTRSENSYLQYTPIALDSTLQAALQTDTVSCDFYTTLDAPAGRMGQAVYNAHGELLGIISNTNPEGRYNTYVYNHTYQRTLVCDINYLVFLLENSGDGYLVDELTFGEPEQLVQIEYINTPTPLPRPDSIQVNDSIKIAINDSLLNDSTFIAQYDSLLRTFSWYNDSTRIVPTDSIVSIDSTSVLPVSEP